MSVCAILASITYVLVHIVVNMAESVGVDASALANEMGLIVGGRGGGKPTMAQAGGNAPDEIPNAFAAAKKALA
jgi:alanyl-tRNA synthetase